MTDATQTKSKMEELEKEIDMLHTALQKKGINSRGTTDIFGREFAVPVDQEHKATQLVLFNVANPHNRAFHTSWFGFFSSFFSMFAAAPLMSKIRKDSSLGLTKAQIGEANISAVSTNIVMRCIVGYMCDLFGPRRSLSMLLFIACPAIIGMLFIPKANCDILDEDGNCSNQKSADAFIACRALIGIALATFVTCQVWCSQMFNKSVVGIANATAAGWGNLGGGVTNLLMPYIFNAFYDSLSGEPLEREDKAWRYCYLVPLGMHVVGGLLVLTGRDLPDGNIKELETSGAKQKSKGTIILKTGLSNVNAWIMVITYGMCFGIELTMNSVAALYFHDYHGLTPRLSGILASLYGLMNLFARSLGGMLSDWANKRFGMRGRLWAMWIVQTIEGVMCILMAVSTLSMDAPFERDSVMAWTKLDVKAEDYPDVYPPIQDGWVPMNGTAFGGKVMTIMGCGCDEEAAPQWFQDKYDVSDSLRMFLEPPFSRDGAAADCISNQGAVGLTVFIMICFSLCVQAAEGLHYGVVPYISRPALGVVSGMVGAGGNTGALISSKYIIGGDFLDLGFLHLGFVIIIGSLTMLLIYFPEEGGAILPKGLPFNPQLIKESTGQKGSDELDFSKAKTGTSEASV